MKYNSLKTKNNRNNRNNRNKFKTRKKKLPLIIGGVKGEEVSATTSNILSILQNYIRNFMMVKKGENTQTVEKKIEKKYQIELKSLNEIYNKLNPGNTIDMYISKIKQDLLFRSNLNLNDINTIRDNSNIFINYFHGGFAYDFKLFDTAGDTLQEKFFFDVPPKTIICFTTPLGYTNTFSLVKNNKNNTNIINYFKDITEHDYLKLFLMRNYVRNLNNNFEYQTELPYINCFKHSIWYYDGQKCPDLELVVSYEDLREFYIPDDFKFYKTNYQNGKFVRTYCKLSNGDYEINNFRELYNYLDHPEKKFSMKLSEFIKLNSDDGKYNLFIIPSCRYFSNDKSEFKADMVKYENCIKIVNDHLCDDFMLDNLKLIQPILTKSRRLNILPFCSIDTDEHYVISKKIYNDALSPRFINKYEPWYYPNGPHTSSILQKLLDGSKLEKNDALFMLFTEEAFLLNVVNRLENIDITYKRKYLSDFYRICGRLLPNKIHKKMIKLFNMYEQTHFLIYKKDDIGLEKEELISSLFNTYSLLLLNYSNNNDNEHTRYLKGTDIPSQFSKLRATQGDYQHILYIDEYTIPSNLSFNEYITSIYLHQKPDIFKINKLFPNIDYLLIKVPYYKIFDLSDVFNDDYLGNLKKLSFIRLEHFKLDNVFSSLNTSFLTGLNQLDLTDVSISNNNLVITDENFENLNIIYLKNIIDCDNIRIEKDIEKIFLYDIKNVNIFFSNNIKKLYVTFCNNFKLIFEKTVNHIEEFICHGCEYQNNIFNFTSKINIDSVDLKDFEFIKYIRYPLFDPKFVTITKFNIDSYNLNYFIDTFNYDKGLAGRVFIKTLRLSKLSELNINFKTINKIDIHFILIRLKNINSLKITGDFQIDDESEIPKVIKYFNKKGKSISVEYNKLISIT